MCIDVYGQEEDGLEGEEKKTARAAVAGVRKAAKKEEGDATSRPTATARSRKGTRKAGEDGLVLVLGLETDFVLTIRSSR